MLLADNINAKGDRADQQPSATFYKNGFTAIHEQPSCWYDWDGTGKPYPIPGTPCRAKASYVSFPAPGNKRATGFTLVALLLERTDTYFVNRWQGGKSFAPIAYRPLTYR